MEEEIKDYVVFGGEANPSLDFLLSLILSKIETGQPYNAGGLFDQPYFLTAFVERWVRDALKERQVIQKATPSSPQEDDFLRALKGLL